MSTVNAVPDGIRAIGWDYDVDPYTGYPVSLHPPATTPVFELETTTTPQVHLPWTPLSYPSVGRQPAPPAPAAAISGR